MSKGTEFIRKAGGCVVSKNILQHKGSLRWCIRETSVNSIDNGWRFFSSIDTDEFLNDENNLAICDFNTVANIEPAVIAIYDLPVGTDLELKYNGGKKEFIDCNTGEKV